VLDLGATRTFDSFAVGGVLVRGMSLRQVLEEGPLDFRSVVSLGIDLAEALMRRHERGAVHGNINPDCVLLTRAGRGMLCDRNCSDAPDLEPAMDQYALGRVLFAACIGDARSVGKLSVDWSRFPTGKVFERLAQIIRRMIGEGTEPRYTSMHTCLADLLQLSAATAPESARKMTPSRSQPVEPTTNTRYLPLEEIVRDDSRPERRQEPWLATDLHGPAGLRAQPDGRNLAGDGSEAPTDSLRARRPTREERRHLAIVASNGVVTAAPPSPPPIAVIGEREARGSFGVRGALATCLLIAFAFVPDSVPREYMTVPAAIAEVAGSCEVELVPQPAEPELNRTEVAKKVHAVALANLAAGDLETADELLELCGTFAGPSTCLITPRGAPILQVQAVEIATVSAVAPKKSSASVGRSSFTQRPRARAARMRNNRARP
jgi:hypothetical protein